MNMRFSLAITRLDRIGNAHTQACKGDITGGTVPRPYAAGVGGGRGGGAVAPPPPRNFQSNFF